MLFKNLCKQRRNIEIDLQLLTEWECPICFEATDKVDISLPFKCDHLTCFQCFEQRCETLRKNNVDPTEMTCCLCRSEVNQVWKVNKGLSIDWLSPGENKFRFYDAV